MAGVATFDDTMADIIYELDDREIFNDIRSQLDYTETETVVDAEEDREYAWSVQNAGKYLDPGQSREGTLAVSSGRIATRWEIQWHGATTGPPHYDDYYDYTVVLSDKTDTTCVVTFKNTGSLYAQVGAHVAYRYLYSTTPEASHEETVFRTLMVRATDPTSIKKYGRRVMNLTWPMGATQEQSQSLVNSYANRYSEPIARVKMTLKGSDDTLRVQILTRKISEKITVISSDLGLNSDFFINNIDFSDNPDELIRLVWILEEVRASEAAGIFMIDTDSIDGPKLIG